MYIHIYIYIYAGHTLKHMKQSVVDIVVAVCQQSFICVYIYIYIYIYINMQGISCSIGFERANLNIFLVTRFSHLGRAYPAEQFPWSEHTPEHSLCGIVVVVLVVVVVVVVVLGVFFVIVVVVILVVVIISRRSSSLPLF